MSPTAYPHINHLLEDLRSRLQAVLGSKMVGLYLYGSLVAGDFDSDTSDIDLMAAVASDIDDVEFAALNAMHEAFLRDYPVWMYRFEIAYISLEALKTYRTQRSQIAITSPGEPFHFKEAGNDWMVNWYNVLVKGITLYGEPPSEIIEPISQEEFIQAVKIQMAEWREWIAHTYRRPSQAYAILTMCRGMYTCKNGEQVSKLQAALWAVKEYPQWAELIQNALVWRKAWQEVVEDPTTTLPQTLAFVNFAIDEVLDVTQ